jgi:hypothetical protein
MFYVLIFSLAGVLLVFAFISTMTRRRRDLAREEGHETHRDARVSHGEAHTGHSGDTSRRTRKAKRAQSQHDRRKRH